MKKSLLAIAISLIATGSVSAIAAAPAPGTQIGTGTLAVTGATAESACTVSFPTSVTLPTFQSRFFSESRTALLVLKMQEILPFQDVMISPLL